MPASIGPIEVVEVVTRYGAKHLAIKDRHDDAMSRYFTACMGTSSWTIESWAANPDHPLGLTADEMVGLDLCTRCVAILRPERPEKVDLRKELLHALRTDHGCILHDGPNPTGRPCRTCVRRVDAVILPLLEELDIYPRGSDGSQRDPA